MSAIRWQVSDDNVSWVREVFPTNAIKTRIKKVKPKLDDGQIFTRRELNTALEFGGKQGQADWLYFSGIERSASRRCTTIYIRKQKKCGGVFSTAWTGRFSVGGGFFDYDNCVFHVKPEVFDKYTCWLEKEDVKVNILQVGTVDSEVAIGVSLEWGATADYHYPDIDPVCTGSVPYPSDVGDPAFGWTCAPGETFMDGSLFMGLTICVRERFQTECIDGIAVPPAGTGWILLIDDCAGTGTATYVRPPEVPVTFDPSTTDPACATGTSALVFPEYIINAPGNPCDGMIIHARYVCYTIGVTEYSTGRLLQAAVAYLVDKSGCGLTGVRSDLFDWDPVGNAPFYLAGENYVNRARGIIGVPSQIDALLILQKSDAIYPAASNPATIGEMTIKEMFRMLCVMFDAFYDIDDAGYVRVEHWIYWATPIGLDLLGRPDTTEPRAYQHLSDRIPHIERMKFMEARGRDFVGKDIIYSGPCVLTQDEESVKEYSPGRITTDIAFILDDPTAISKDGFVLLATIFNGSVYKTIIGPGAITGNDVTNSPLSTANLEATFWTFRRYLRNGNMNAVDTIFDGIRANIEQQGIVTKMCCEALQFQMGYDVLSALGGLLGGIPAQVEDAELDLYGEVLTLTLRYAY